MRRRGPVGQADLGGSHGLPSAAQERPQLAFDHLHILPTVGAVCRSPVRASLDPVSLERAPCRSVAAMTTTTPTTVATGATSTAPPLTQGTWALDTNHTSVGFAIRRLGLAKVRGHFSDVSAELVVGSTIDDCHVTATVALASIDTGNADRDAHLRTADLLDVENRPTMSYRSTSVHGDGIRVDRRR